MLTSGHEVAVTHINSWHLRLPVLGLRKIELVKTPARGERGCQQLMAAEGGLAFADTVAGPSGWPHNHAHMGNTDWTGGGECANNIPVKERH